MLYHLSTTSPPMDRAKLHAAIGLGAILFLFLLALGFLCSNRTKRQRERDVEQEQWEQEEEVLGHGRVMDWERTDRSSCMIQSRADSATSSLFGAEDRGKRDQPGYRGASQQRSSTTEQCSTAASAMEQTGHHQPSERPLPTLSEATTWQEQNLDPSMPHHSNHWRQSSMHSIANRLSFRQPSLSKTRYGRQLCNKMAAAGAERHFPTLATILEPEAALHAVSMSESHMRECEEAACGQ